MRLLESSTTRRREGGCPRSAIVLALFALAAGGLQAQTALTANLSGTTLSVSGVTPGGSIAVFGLAHKTEDFHSRLERVLEIEVDNDSDGNVQLIHESFSVPTSMWVAVDLSAGTFVPATGVPEFNPASISTPEFDLDATGTEAIGVRLIDRGAVEALWIRPGAGYWELAAADGGAGEAIGDPDGMLELACASFTDNPDHTDPPEGLRRKDLLVFIDPWTLDWTVKTGADLGLPEEQ